MIPDMTISEAAARWGCSVRSVQLFCSQQRIPGARKISGIWLLPGDSVRPGSRKEAISDFRPETLYGQNTTVRLTPSPGDSQTAQSGCTVTQFSVLEGITLVFQDIHEEYLDYGTEIPQLPGDLIAIQHCREGRFEGEYPNGEYIYMGPGSLSVNLPAWAPVSNSFPLKHYRGFYIAILPKAAEASVGELEQILGPLHIDFAALTRGLSGKNRLALYAPDEKISRLLSDLYSAGEDVQEAQLKLQVLELLQCLCAGELLSRGTEQYFPREQVQTIKEVRRYLIAHPDQHFPLSELSARFRISLTCLKTCFKGVFGQSIGKYLREYRMQAGAEQLTSTHARIIDIASSLGYENASKFSQTFSEYFGMSPSEYRKNFCPSGGISDGKG